MFRQCSFSFGTFQLILILGTLLLNGQGHNSSAAPWEALLDMDIFCPGADVCRQYSSKPKQNVTFLEGYTSCCRDCSCADDCGRTRDCCFPTLDTQKLVGRDRQQCVLPRTNYSTEDRYLFNSYFMVAENPPSGCKQDGDISVAHGKHLLEDACGEQTVAPWGSLLPVYSKRTGLIYKNTRCAKCHGISDGVVWNSVLECRHFDTDNYRDRSMSSHMQQLEFKLNTSHCIIRFIYPGASTDIRSEMCFLNVIDTCNGNSFRINDGVSITQTEVVEACENGLLSVYRHREHSVLGVYANVFCAICNGEYFEESTMSCISLDTDGQRKAPLGEFFVTLLDYRYIESLQQAAEASVDVPFVCEIEGIYVNRSNCRRLQCPSGQVRFQEGACGYPSANWNGPTAVYIKLFPEAPIVVSSFEKLLLNNTSIYNPILKSPWPKPWRIDQMFYLPKTDGLILNHFVVLMAYTSLNEAPPKRIIKSIKRNIPRIWTISLNDSITELVPEISEYQKLVAKKGKMIPLWAWASLGKELESNHQFLLKKLTVPTLSVVFLTEFDEYITVTEMFFCQQVQLKANEFVLYANNAIMYYNESDTLLFDGQFEIVYDDAGNYVPRICLDDARFKQITRASSAFGSVSVDGMQSAGYALCIFVALRLFLHVIN